MFILYILYYSSVGGNLGVKTIEPVSFVPSFFVVIDSPAVQ